MLKAGLRLACPDCTIEVVLVRAPTAEVELTCSGSALVDMDSPRRQGGHPAVEGEGALLGKRYVDETTDLEVLCTKAGPGQLACDGRLLGIRGAKPLPSSD
ncbi:MAG TPA: hypothetical protein VG205_05195 [Acidimicrobiales bacterium]|jgi:hypothetical protein|nr:hypothetical protein [Acidimicrobiales bacterium]